MTFPNYFHGECIQYHVFQQSLCYLAFVQLPFLQSFHWTQGAKTTTTHLFLSPLFHSCRVSQQTHTLVARPAPELEISLRWECKVFSGLFWMCTLPLAGVRLFESFLIHSDFDYPDLPNKNTAWYRHLCLWLFSPGLGVCELSPGLRHLQVSVPVLHCSGTVPTTC